MSPVKEHYISWKRALLHMYHTIQHQGWALRQRRAVHLRKRALHFPEKSPISRAKVPYYTSITWFNAESGLQGAEEHTVAVDGHVALSLDRRWVIPQQICMQHTWRSRISNMDESCHVRMSHVAYRWAISDMSTRYGVATISRLLKIIGLFCKKAL